MYIFRYSTKNNRNTISFPIWPSKSVTQRSNQDLASGHLFTPPKICKSLGLEVMIDQKLGPVGVNHPQYHHYNGWKGAIIKGKFMEVYYWLCHTPRARSAPCASAPVPSRKTWGCNYGIRKFAPSEPGVQTVFTKHSDALYRFINLCSVSTLCTNIANENPRFIVKSFSQYYIHTHIIYICPPIDREFS